MQTSKETDKTSDQFVYPVGKNSFKKGKKRKKNKKWTQKSDDADDKKNGIKEGSKEDVKKDESRGLFYHKKRKGGYKTKPQGRGIVKALGQKKTTGNFKKIEAAKGKGAAIGALQNKLARVQGRPAPYGGKRAKSGEKMLKSAMKKMACK